MKTRIISGICMVPLLGLVYLGGYWLAALCIFVGLVGVKEFFQGFENMGIHPSYKIAYVMTFCLYLLHGLWQGSHDLILPWIVAVIILSSLYMFDAKKVNPQDAMATMIGLLYVVFFSYHVLLVDGTGEYSMLVWLILLSAFGADTFAYFSGVFLGKHKMCPNLSPKKTWEGAIGGIIGSGLVCGIFGFFFFREIMIHCVIIGLIGAPISMCGDLTASAYKRKMGIKDYGNLIPGHGGIMDRFDSVLFTAPFVYYYIQIVFNFLDIA